MPTCNQRDNCANILDHNEQKHHEPKDNKVFWNKCVLTIPNINNEESKTSIWPEIEKIKGTTQLTKIKEALDLQILLFTNEEQRLKYIENQYGLFSPNSWYNIIFTIFMLFLILLTIRGLLILKKRKALNSEKNKTQI